MEGGQKILGQLYFKSQKEIRGMISKICTEFCFKIGDLDGNFNISRNGGFYLSYMAEHPTDRQTATQPHGTTHTRIYNIYTYNKTCQIYPQISA